MSSKAEIDQNRISKIVFGTNTKNFPISEPFFKNLIIDGLLTIQIRHCVPLCALGWEQSLPKVSATAVENYQRNCHKSQQLLAQFFYAKNQVFRSFFLGYVRNILDFCWVYANLATEGS